MTKQHKIGDLEVWWIPQVPMHAFRVPVASVNEALKLLKVLAEYDLFQLHNRIKPDYANAGGLEIWTDDGWEEWDDPETGDDIDALLMTERGAR